MYSYKRERAKRLYPEPAIFNRWEGHGRKRVGGLVGPGRREGNEVNEMLLLVETLGFLAPSPCSDVRAKTTRIAVLEYRSIDTLMG